MDCPMNMSWLQNLVGDSVVLDKASLRKANG